jgi:hypothetical protein
MNMPCALKQQSLKPSWPLPDLLTIQMASHRHHSAAHSRTACRV